MGGCNPQRAWEGEGWHLARNLTKKETRMVPAPVRIEKSQPCQGIVSTLKKFLTTVNMIIICSHPIQCQESLHQFKPDRQPAYMVQPST